MIWSMGMPHGSNTATYNSIYFRDYRYYRGRWGFNRNKRIASPGRHDLVYPDG